MRASISMAHGSFSRFIYITYGVLNSRAWKEKLKTMLSLLSTFQKSKKYIENVKTKIILRRSRMNLPIFIYSDFQYKKKCSITNTNALYSGCWFMCFVESFIIYIIKKWLWRDIPWLICMYVCMYVYIKGYSNENANYLRKTRK